MIGEAMPQTNKATTKIKGVSRKAAKSQRVKQEAMSRQDAKLAKKSRSIQTG